MAHNPRDFEGWPDMPKPGMPSQAQVDALMRRIRAQEREPETLDMPVCDAHGMAHESDRKCPLCVDGVPVIEPEPEGAPAWAAWAIAGFAVLFVCVAMVGAYWATTPSADQAEALASILSGVMQP